MWTAILPAISSAIIAGVVSITVPQITFNFTRRLEEDRWRRGQRSQLYIDLLSEAHAEKSWFLGELSDRYRLTPKVDTRMSPTDRVRLGARCTQFASDDVQRKFNKIGAIILGYDLGLDRAVPEDEDAQNLPSIRLGNQIAVQRELAAAFNELEQAIERETKGDTRKNDP
ncbi:hypothetical protein [Labedaea rhizosphaerae]|uniref:Uncharacterized protein n=1 Tax=Labedaea rhizosphaerae TaxID=598644 RepID=A0A4R6SPP1_LABRH|nr:hypothetical protein [Labedaea rhizosphaerae]TDQ05462.1 hypothetical protein EV186_1011433 [Labedaea rhizosphaerae]